MSGQSIGSQSALLLDSVAPIDGSSEPYYFLSENLVAQYDLIDDGEQAIRGTRSHPEERVSQGLVRVGGSIVMNPTPLELDNLLPRILGAAEVTDLFSVAETLPSFLVAINRIAKFHTYAGAKVNKAIFSGGSGKPLQLELQILAQTETEGAAGSFPSVAEGNQTPYNFTQGVITLGGATQLFNQFVLIVDNHLSVEFNNSRTATDIVAADRSVFLALSTPYTSTETTLFTTPVASAAGDSAATLVFTSGTKSLTFTFGNLKSFARTPSVRNKGQIRLPLRYKAYEIAGVDEIAVTNDPV